MFERNQIICRKDKDYPHGALVVYEQDENGLLTYPLGGGFRIRIPNEQVSQFDPISEAERISLFVRKKFGVDGIEGTFKGFSDGLHWNGWSKPLFDKHTAERVLDASGCEWEYDEQQDAFVFTNGDDESEVVAAQIIPLPDGGEIKAYGIGSGSWIWEEV